MIDIISTFCAILSIEWLLQIGVVFYILIKGNKKFPKWLLLRMIQIPFYLIYELVIYIKEELDVYQ